MRSPLHRANVRRAHSANSPRDDSPDGRGRSDRSSAEFAGKSEPRPGSPSASSAASRWPQGPFRPPDVSKNPEFASFQFLESPVSSRMPSRGMRKTGRTEDALRNVRSGRFPCAHDGPSATEPSRFPDSLSISTRRSALSGSRACVPRFIDSMHDGRKARILPEVIRRTGTAAGRGRERRPAGGHPRRRAWARTWAVRLEGNGSGGAVSRGVADFQSGCGRLRAPSRAFGA